MKRKVVSVYRHTIRIRHVGGCQEITHALEQSRDNSKHMTATPDYLSVNPALRKVPKVVETKANCTYCWQYPI